MLVDLEASLEMFTPGQAFVEGRVEELAWTEACAKQPSVQLR